MARQLHAEGQRVGLLALLDSPYPRRPTRLGRLRLIAACEVTNLGALTAGRKAVYLLEKARRALVVGTPRLAGALGLSRPVDHLRKVEWTHLHAARAWVPQPYGGPLTLFVTRPRSSRPGEDPHAGWRAAALGGLTVCEIPGDDVVIVEEPRVRLLAERLGACLASA
jgi:thioesterase domain-containing protein